MLIPFENKKIFFAAKPVDFRQGIDGLSTLINNEQNTHIYDGSIYVFHNANKDKIKCLFWDDNGFVVYYKRLDKCKFKFQAMMNSMETITQNDLKIILSGFEPRTIEQKPIKSNRDYAKRFLEHKA